MDLKKSKIIPKLNIRQKLIYDKLLIFFTKDKIELLIHILNGKSKISLRIIDWFVTNYTKKNNIIINNRKKINKSLINKTKKILFEEEQFNIYLNYKRQLKAYSKKNFDPFCRRERLNFYYNNDDFIITTVGQLNFFKWAIVNNIITYINNNIDIIEKDMNQNIKRIEPDSFKKSKKKNMEPQKKRKKRRELSNAVNNKLNKHNLSITLDFE